MNPKVSIVVPVYNVEAYLDRCVSSLKAQSLKEIEIILVDDGSTDHSSEMCDAFSADDDRIRVIHKSNGGLSSARNAGMEVAKGEYIGFVDADDSVDELMYESLYKTALSNTAEIVMCDYLRITHNGETLKKTESIDEGAYNEEKLKKVIYPSLIMGENLDYGPLLSVCLCLYNHAFLLDNNLHFNESVKWSEDNLFSAIASYCCKRFYYLKHVYYYHYYQNQGTITTSYRQGAWTEYCRLNQCLIDYFGGIQNYDFSCQLKYNLIYYACNCIGQELAYADKQSVQRIDDILNSEELQTAFQNISFIQVPLKLKVQLILMKYRLTRLLVFSKRVF